MEPAKVAAIINQSNEVLLRQLNSIESLIRDWTNGLKLRACCGTRCGHRFDFVLKEHAFSKLFASLSPCLVGLVSLMTYARLTVSFPLSHCSEAAHP